MRGKFLFSVLSAMFIYYKVNKNAVPAAGFLYAGKSLLELLCPLFAARKEGLPFANWRRSLGG
jgi:hypothetical protein